MLCALCVNAREVRRAQRVVVWLRPRCVIPLTRKVYASSANFCGAVCLRPCRAVAGACGLPLFAPEGILKTFSSPTRFPLPRRRVS